MALKTHLKLGDMLINQGLINDAQLKEAIERQKKTRERMGEALISLKYVTEEQLAEALARQMEIPFARFSTGELTPAADPQMAKILPLEIIRKSLILPLSKQGTLLTVAISDPLDLMLMDNLKRQTSCQINPVIATRSDLQQAIDAAFGEQSLLKEVTEATKKEEEEGGLEKVEEHAGDEGVMTEDVTAQAGEASVIRFVDLLLLEAVKGGASDIHVEPYPDRISIRMRIDGVLKPIDAPARSLLHPIVSRIKILANMDISEKRLPQDGGFTIKQGTRVVDLRISSVPTIYGERVVIRLLDKSNLPKDFTKLGLEGKALQDIEQALTVPYGLIIITGPTGSGKSTTLYTCINQMISPKKNILTVEDPVEYKITGISQVQAKPHIGLTFAAALRSFLRQDPDIIMLGEIRDLETAEICVRAALTGHLVLSTLHTNDAPSAVTRLVDLGIEPFLLSPSLVLIIAQRLVRKLCPECKEPTEPPQGIREKVPLPEGQLYKPKGCPTCKNIGYKGRMGVYEVMRVTEPLRELIARGGQAEEIRKLAREQGMKTLLEYGLAKAAQGATTLEEVLSATIGNI